MPNYLCIQRSQPSDSSAPQEKPSPEKMQQMMASFNAWREKYGSNLVDMGGPLGGATVVTAGSTTEGPFSESNFVVGGYMIVSAESLEEAAQIAQESPGVMRPGSSVEVREIKTMG